MHFRGSLQTRTIYVVILIRIASVLKGTSSVDTLALVLGALERLGDEPCDCGLRFAIVVHAHQVAEGVVWMEPTHRAPDAIFHPERGRLHYTRDGTPLEAADYTSANINRHVCVLQDREESTEGGKGVWGIL